MGSMGINIRSCMSFERWVVDDREVPLDVRTRQFKTMAKVFGYSSVEAFGLAVEKMKSETRTQLLGVFYRHRRELLTRNKG